MKEFIENKFLLAGILISLAVAGIISYYASSSPDGLEKVAEEKGFLDTAKDPINAGSPLADYGVEGIGNDRLSVGLSGVIGVFATLIASYFLFKFIARKKS
jgi:cobalt/nickel transport protein